MALLGRFALDFRLVLRRQMLFLMTAISKMKEPRDGGARMHYSQWNSFLQAMRAADLLILKNIF